MIPELFAAGLIVSACLVIFLDEPVYSVAALALVFVLTALLYALSGAIFASVFQFAVGVGTLAILFLSGEMLSEKPQNKTSLSKALPVAFLGALLSLPSIIFSFSESNSALPTVSFADALWNLRGVDVILQGLVIMTVALGIVIVLYEKKGGRDE